MTAPADAARRTASRVAWAEGARLTIRLHRFEIIAFGLALGGLSIAAVLASFYLGSIAPPPECRSFTDSTLPSCEAVRTAFYDAQGRIGGLLLAPLLLVTSAIGLFLGVPIVARELERGTVRLAWSLSPTRWRWYVVRVVPVLLVVVGLTVAAGLAADLFFAASTPGVDAAASFNGYGARGVVLAGRATFLFAIAVVVGAILGRALPAVIVAALIAAIGFYGALQLNQQLLRSEAVTVPIDESQGGDPNDLYFDQLFVLPDGTLVGYDYFPNGSPYDDSGNPLYPTVSLVVPAERYSFAVARETAGFGLAAIVILASGAAVVSRRRPT